MNIFNAVLQEVGGLTTLWLLFENKFYQPLLVNNLMRDSNVLSLFPLPALRVELEN
jgi:hypothetical protein